MTDDVTPGAPGSNDQLGRTAYEAWCRHRPWSNRLPTPWELMDRYERSMWVAAADAVQAAERERWIGGVRVQIPTETMEQEIQAHVRRAVSAERDVREACAELRDALGNPVVSGTMEQTLHGQIIRMAAARLHELRAELAATQRAWRDDSNAKALEIERLRSRMA